VLASTAVCAHVGLELTASGWLADSLNMPAGCGREPDNVAVAVPERGLATAGAR